MRISFFILVSILLVQSIRCQTKQSRSFLLRDEGKSQLSLVDLGSAKNNWHQSVPKGRDLQLVGNDLVLIGTENGYEERSIKTGKLVSRVDGFPGTIAARRLKNKNTILVGLNWQDKEGITLIELDKSGGVVSTINYPGFDYARLVRETPKGTFLITSNQLVIEGNREGEIIWKAQIGGRENPHAWQAIRLTDGRTIVAGGYGGSIQVFNNKSTLVRAFCGPEEERGNFYSGLQILQNGNIVVTNWQGHGPDQGNLGTQLLEFSPEGKLIWSWNQDPNYFSSLQGVIILDGLNTGKLHVENEAGVLTPVD
ncbi:MAG: PQQ-binding-like beta-propeller repeat protein [Cyclobacteriaceae bacterium]